MRVQLFGGGIDSVCIAHLWKPDIKVYFHLGTEEAKHEARVAEEFGARVDYRLSLGDQVLPNKILPARNLLLVTMASYYGNEIILGSTAGDTTRDKDARFISLATETLDHILGHDHDKALPFHAAGVRVIAPARRYTKTELVAEYLKMHGSSADLLHSRSCYSSGDKECGECRSCVRKYVALELNGIPAGHLFEVQTDLLQAYEYAKARNRGKETEDIKKLMK